MGGRTRRPSSHHVGGPGGAKPRGRKPLRAEGFAGQRRSPHPGDERDHPMNSPRSPGPSPGSPQGAAASSSTSPPGAPSPVSGSTSRPAAVHLDHATAKAVTLGDSTRVRTTTGCCCGRGARPPRLGIPAPIGRGPPICAGSPAGQLKGSPPSGTAAWSRAPGWIRSRRSQPPPVASPAPGDHRWAEAHPAPPSSAPSCDALFADYSTARRRETRQLPPLRIFVGRTAAKTNGATPSAPRPRARQGSEVSGPREAGGSIAVFSPLRTSDGRQPRRSDVAARAFLEGTSVQTRSAGRCASGAPDPTP